MKTRTLFGIVVMSFFLILVTNFVNAQVPQLLNYQGKLVKADGKAEDGTFKMIFSIYSTETGGTALWSETQNTVTVSKGIFNVLLNVPGNIFTTSGDRFLGIKVGDGAEMTPRFRLSSVPYAQRTAEADAVADNAITNAKIANNSVTSGKIQDGQVGTDDLAANAVSSSKIASGQVVKSINNLKDNVTLAAGSNVTLTPSGNTITITASGTTLPDGAVTTPKIADNAVTNAKIANSAVSSTKIQDGQVLNADLANNAVTSTKIQDGTITAADIGNDAVGSSEIAAGAVAADEIASNAVTSDKIANETIRDWDIADEPGISQGKRNGDFTLTGNTTSMVDVITTSLTIPTSGYIVVEASAQARLSGTTSANYMSFQIDETAGGSENNNHYYYVGFNPSPSTATHWFPVSTRRIYYKSSSGAYTFRFEARDKTSTGSKWLWNATITAMFIPTAYGPVAEGLLAGEAPASVPTEITTVGDNGTGSSPSASYLIDLREVQRVTEQAENEKER